MNIAANTPMQLMFFSPAPGYFIAFHTISRGGTRILQLFFSVAPQLGLGDRQDPQGVGAKPFMACMWMYDYPMARRELRS